MFCAFLQADDVALSDTFLGEALELYFLNVPTVRSVKYGENPSELCPDVTAISVMPLDTSFKWLWYFPREI